MRAHETDPDYAIVIVDSDHKPVVVPLDVEHHPIVIQETRRRIVPFDIARTFPGCPFRFLVPAFQLLFAIRMPGPERPKRASGNYSHMANIQRKFPNWEQGRVNWNFTGSKCLPQSSLSQNRRFRTLLGLTLYDSRVRSLLLVIRTLEKPETRQDNDKRAAAFPQKSDPDMLSRIIGAG
jgi:hypothetical protein